MDAFLKALQTLPEVAELISRVENGGCPAVLTGTQPVQRACIGAAVAAGAGRPMVFLCADEREARQLAGDLQSLTGSGSSGPTPSLPGSGSGAAWRPCIRWRRGMPRWWSPRWTPS